MRKTVFFFLLFIFACSQNETTTNIFSGSFEQAKKKAQKEGKLLLINFTSDSR